MAHLGYLITALADGELDPGVAEKALEHVAVCRECADELAAERRARRTVAQAGHGDVPPALVDRLQALGGMPPPPAPRLHAPRSGKWMALGSLAGAGALATVLLVTGAPRAVSPQLSMSQSLSMLAVAAETPAAAPTAPVGFVVPTAAPGFHVTSSRAVDGRLEIDLAGRGGHVVLVEQRGRLDASALAGLAVEQVGGVSVYVLDHEPWHVVWQCGDVVVELVTDLPPTQVADLVAHFPADDYDTGLAARLQRGWSVLTGGTGS